MVAGTLSYAKNVGHRGVQFWCGARLRPASFSCDAAVCSLDVVSLWTPLAGGNVEFCWVSSRRRVSLLGAVCDWVGAFRQLWVVLIAPRTLSSQLDLCVAMLLLAPASFADRQFVFDDV